MNDDLPDTTNCWSDSWFSRNSNRPALVTRCYCWSGPRDLNPRPP